MDLARPQAEDKMQVWNYLFRLWEDTYSIFFAGTLSSASCQRSSLCSLILHFDRRVDRRFRSARELAPHAIRAERQTSEDLILFGCMYSLISSLSLNNS